MDTQTLLAILGIGALLVGILTGVSQILADLDKIGSNLNKIGNNLRDHLLHIGHPWIALGAALAGLFILVAPLFATALPSSIPRYDLTNLLSIALPLVPWLAAIWQAVRSGRWGWMVSAVLVGAGAYLTLAVSSWGGALLVLLYLLPALIALLFGLSSRPARKQT